MLLLHRGAEEQSFDRATDMRIAGAFLQARMMSGQAGTSTQSVSWRDSSTCSLVRESSSRQRLAATCHLQSFLASRATLAAATTLSVGSIAYYTHLYGTIPFLPEASANTAAEDGLHPTQYPWSHRGIFDTFDHAA
jgi:ubiquinol-cytochrome c reductase cytochrome c1 subunit